MASINLSLHYGRCSKVAIIIIIIIIIKAPLIIGCDLGSMTDATKNILMNEEVIAVN
jgi:hypothetical protein